VIAMRTAPTPPKVTSPLILQDIAALVFWDYCFRFSFEETEGRIMEGNFEDLWTRDQAAMLLARYIPDPDANVIDECYEATNAYMLDHVGREKNLIGRVYAEDFGTRLP
jgi:hypothetical protein